ncbi:MAG: hypothetical protein HYY43_02295, partial [Deltaproteobacteria bacterium]|nr:hypothetical protein [Deltaproteobacteria bacterium]
MAIGTEILRYIARPLFRDAHDFWAEQYADLKADFESTGYYRTTADYWATHTLAQGGLEAIGEIDKFVQTGILKDIHDPSLAAKAGIGMAFLKFFGASSLGIADNELKIINEIPRGPAAVVYRTGEIGCEIATGVYNSGIFVFSQIAGLVDGEMARWPDGKDVYQASKEFTETGIMAS